MTYDDNPFEPTFIDHDELGEAEALEEAWTGSLSRRDVLASAAALGLALPAMALLPGNTAAARAAAFQRAARQPKGQIVFATRMSELADLHPFTARLSRAMAVSYQINEGLVKFAPDLSIVPGLASSWSVSKNELVYTFRLRTGVKWHDGAAFDGDDVKFTFGAAVAVNSQSAARTVLTKYIRRLRVSGNTVVITLREPYSPLLSVLATQLQMLPAHRLRGKVYDAGFRQSPVGTGPFRIAARTNGALTLAANTRYWGFKPYAARIVLSDAPDTASQQAGFLSGELDVISYVPTAMSGLRGQGFPVYAGAANSTHGIVLDLQNPILQDVRVRQALALGLDRQRAKQLHYTGGVLADSVVSTAYGAYHDTKVKAIPYDVPGANAILENAGWKRDPRTGIRSKGGEPLQLTHYAWAAQQWQDIAAIAQASWKQIGVDVRIVRADNSQIATIISGKYDVAPLGLGLTNDPISGLVQLLRTTNRTFKEGGTLNVFRYSNKEVDAALDRATRVSNRAARIKAAHFVQQRARTGMPFIPIAYPAHELITKKNIVLHERNRGLSGIAVGYFMSKWRVK